MKGFIAAIAAVAGLHEGTRRTICRGAYLLVGVLPTLGLIAWAAAANLPAVKRTAEARLIDAFELAVTLGDVSFPRPGVTLYENAQIADPETGRVVAVASWIEIRVEAGTTIVEIAGAEADDQHLDRLYRAIERRMRVQQAAASAPVRIVARQFTLFGERGSATLANLLAELRVTDEAARLAIRFSLPEAAGETPVQLQIDRLHAEPAETRIELRTGGAPLPLPFVEPIWPGLAALGKTATYRGYAWAKHDGDRWSGEFTGRLEGVDMESLVGRHSTHRLTGRGAIELAKLSFAAGRIATLEGRLEAGPGAIGVSLLESLHRELGMTAAVENLPASDRAAYESLAVTFRVNAQSATIEGTCSGAAVGCAISGKDGPLLYQTATQPRPTLDLLRVLSPSAKDLVPATKETDALLDWFPLPASAVIQPAARLRDAKAN